MATTLRTPASILFRWIRGIDALTGTVLIMCMLVAAVRPDSITVACMLLIAALTIELIQLRSKAAHVTESRQHIEVEKKLLKESIECAPVAFAVYDPDDRLIAWNSSYEAFFPKIFSDYHAGQLDGLPDYVQIIREAAPENLSPPEFEDFIRERGEAKSNADGVAIDRYYDNGGWHRITKFITPSGAVAGFGVDINALKENETELQAEIARRQSVETALRQLATTDSLTGVLNRREFMRCVSHELTIYERDNTVFSLILLDIDWFKSINDRFGHQVGDAVIVEVVRAIDSQLRDGVDKLGRLGGEEFGTLLPGTDAREAADRAGKIRQRIEQTVFDASEGTSISVTASLGITTVALKNARLTTLIGQADQAMYVSKANGRNRATAYHDKMLAHPAAAEAADGADPKKD